MDSNYTLHFLGLLSGKVDVPKELYMHEDEALIFYFLKLLLTDSSFRNHVVRFCRSLLLDESDSRL
jgi:hypothetical protein